MSNLFKIKLPKIVKTHPIAFWTAVVLHFFLLFGLIFSNFQSWEVPIAKSKTTPKYVPKAITIDLSEIKKEKQRLFDSQQQQILKIQREEKRLRVLEDERYKKQKNINKLKTQTKQQKEAKILAEKKKKEAQKQAEKAEKKKKEAQKQAEKAERKKDIANKKALTAQKEQRKLEQKIVNESKKFQTEQSKRELTKEIQDEEIQERKIAKEDILNELKTSYINQIAARVREKWFYQGAKDDWGCDVYILQDLNNNVQSVNIKSCNIDNSTKAQSFKNSIERAVKKASPLPAAPDQGVFEREVLLHFKVN